MTDLIIAYIKLLLIAFLYVIHTELSFGRSIALSYITMAMLMFISTIIRDFSLFNKVLLCFMAVLLLAALMRRRLDQNHIRDALKRFLRPGLVIFSVLFFYLYSVDRHLSLSQIDDFLRWGGMVRDCMNNNVLYSRDLPVMIKPGKYPPFTTLISVFFNKSMRGYNESWSLLAIGSFCLSLMMPATEKLEWKKRHIPFIVLYPLLIMMALLCVQLNAHMQYPAFIFNSTYVDWVMSLMTAYGLYQTVIFSGTDGDYLAFALLLTGLILADRISAAFALLIIGAWLLRILVMKENNRKILAGFAAATLLPLCIYGGWKYYVSSFTGSTAAVKPAYEIAERTGGEKDNAAMLAASPVRVSYALSNDEDTDEPPFDFSNYREDTMHNFIKALGAEPVMTRPFNLNYYLTVAVLTALLAGLGLLRKNRPLIVVSIVFLLGSAAYAVSMLYGYMHFLNEYEATGLAAYGRYMETYTYSGLALVFLVLLDRLQVKETAAAALLACLCIEPQSISTITPKTEDVIYRPEDRAMIEYYISNVYQGESLVVVNQTDMVYRQFIKYLFGAYGDNVYYFQGNQYRYGNLKDFTWSLDRRDLIMIADYDDYFYEHFWSQVTDEPLQYSCIYRIIRKETGYDLEPVYHWYSPQWE